MLTASPKYAQARSVATSMHSRPTRLASIRRVQLPLARRARRAWNPAASVRGSKTLRPAVSRTTRTTASGRPSAASASQADSMSTASAPSAFERAPLVRRHDLLDARGSARCARAGRDAAAAAASTLRSGTAIGSPPARRSSVAQTTSPGAKLGRDRAADAGDRHRAARRRRAPRAAAMRARAGPMPVRSTVQPRNARQRRRLEAERREHEQIAHSPLPRIRPSAITGNTCR